MKRFFVCICVCFLNISCKESKAIDHCSEFEFKGLDKDTRRWSDDFEPVDSYYFKDQIAKIKEFKYYDPKSFFRACEISSDNLNGRTVININGPTIYLYFIPNHGDKAFLLACVEASLDYYLVKKSKLTSHENLEMTTIHVFDEEADSNNTSDSIRVVKDSIVTRYSIKNNIFTKISSDSIRSIRQ